MEGVELPAGERETRAAISCCHEGKPFRLSVLCRVGRSMQAIKTPASREAELEKLRRELLRRIVQNEARRRNGRTNPAK